MKVERLKRKLAMANEKIREIEKLNDVVKVKKDEIIVNKYIKYFVKVYLLDGSVFNAQLDLREKCKKCNNDSSSNKKPRCSSRKPAHDFKYKKIKTLEKTIDDIKKGFKEKEKRQTDNKKRVKTQYNERRKIEEALDLFRIIGLV